MALVLRTLDGSRIEITAGNPRNSVHEKTISVVTDDAKEMSVKLSCNDIEDLKYMLAR